MEKVKCELCGKDIEKPEKMCGVFGHLFCDECADKFKEYIEITVNIAEQERRRKPTTIFMGDISEFIKIKDGTTDIIRAAREYERGDMIDIHYDGLAYKDIVKCKVAGCHKSAGDGYIIELINL